MKASGIRNDAATVDVDADAVGQTRAESANPDAGKREARHRMRRYSSSMPLSKNLGGVWAYCYLLAARKRQCQLSEFSGSLDHRDDDPQSPP